MSASFDFWIWAEIANEISDIEIQPTTPKAIHFSHGRRRGPG